MVNWGLCCNVDWISICGWGGGGRYKVGSNKSSWCRRGIIRFSEGECGKRCSVRIVEEGGDVYEFYISDWDGNGD